MSPSSVLLFIRVVKISVEMLKFCFDVDMYLWRKVENMGDIIYFDGLEIFCDGGQVVVTTHVVASGRWDLPPLLASSSPSFAVMAV